MFGVTLLIIAAAALLGTALTAGCLQIFFRVVEPEKNPAVVTSAKHATLSD